jgi:ML domain
MRIINFDYHPPSLPKEIVTKMVVTSTFTKSLLLAAPLLISSTLSVALPSDSQQLVFGGNQVGESNGRQADFVDVILSEAEKAGIEFSQWEENVKNRPTTKESVNLNDEFAKAALMAEAVAEDTLVWIQPKIEEAEESVEEVMESVVESLPELPSTQTQPGSGWIWEVCGSRQEAVVLKEINVKPDPPVPGQNLTVYAKGIVNEDIEPGTYADVVVKLGFIRLLSKRFDVCELAEENDAELKCPKKQGEYEITHTVELPREIPPARFNVHVNGKTQADVDLMCLDLNIDFGRH